MEHLRYTVLFQEEPEGGFTVTVPALPGCITYGKNLDDAKEMVADAILGYIASLQKHNEPIPSDSATLISSVEVKRPSRVRRALAHV
ncbi:MAG: type II toxin-antitoxin system HicB family antitoxin [Patescibacteria group bacterium]